MSEFHLFLTTETIQSEQDFDEYVEPLYLDNGDSLPSPFAEQTGLGNYEPDCLELIYEAEAQPLELLLSDCSYSEKWLAQLPQNLQAKGALLVFAPNTLSQPHNSQLSYIGHFSFER